MLEKKNAIKETLESLGIKASRPVRPSDIRRKYQRKAAALSQEIRQSVLDDFRGGLSIGEVKEKHDLELMVVCEIISQNIEAVDVLRTVAK